MGKTKRPMKIMIEDRCYWLLKTSFDILDGTFLSKTSSRITWHLALYDEWKEMNSGFDLGIRR